MGYANTTAWDTLRKGSGITLSGSNLIATGASGHSVQSNNPISGLTYFEMLLGATLSGSSSIGIRRVDASVLGLLGASDSTRSVGYLKTGAVTINNITQTTIETYAATDNIGVAVDPFNYLIWFRKNGGNWNNDVIGNQNPVGAVGGISFSSVGTPIYAGWGGTATSSVTAKFASADWTYTAPTGFLSMDTLGTTKFDNKAVADLTETFSQYGNILTSAPPTPAQRTQFPSAVGAWFGNQKTFSPAGTFTTISGVVQENGSPVSGKTVYLYNSANGEFLGEATSDGSGEFSIPALAKTNVYAVALDPAYRAIIFDQLTPV